LLLASPTKSSCIPFVEVGYTSAKTDNHMSRKQKVKATMRTELLRFDGALERDLAIDAWMKEHSGELGAIAHHWFEVMRKCGHEVRLLAIYPHRANGLRSRAVLRPLGNSQLKTEEIPMRNKFAHSLLILACLVLLASAAIHCLGAYPHLSLALAASNLAPPLPAGLRSAFLLVAWDWIAIAVIALMAGFSASRVRKTIVLFCAVALLVSAGIIFHFLRWFIGDELLGAAGLLMAGAGFLFE
jgi:hypothetical protein